jgi:hypothetical protein
LAMVLPGFSGMWEERKLAQAETTLLGVLTSTRAKALRGSEQGLFFYVDPVSGRQMIVPIAPDPPNADPESLEYKRDCDGKISAQGSITDCITDLMAQDRFLVVEGDVYELPQPFRVVPREVVELDKDANPLWSDADLALNDFNKAPAGGWPQAHPWPHHRNFFTVIFGPDGKLIPGRDVLIRDPALSKTSSPTPKFVTGYRTKLRVSVQDGGQNVDVNEYYKYDPATHTETIEPLDTSGNRTLYDIIVELASGGAPSPNAINFLSVDGVLLYDDKALADVPFQLGQTFKRQYLLENGRPLYISRLTGEVLEGPKGENQ